MAVVALMDAGAPVSLQVAWAAWFARARRQALTVLVPDADAEGGDRLLLQARALLARDGAFVVAEEGEPDAEGGDGQLRARAVSAGSGAADGVLEQLQQAFADLFVVLTPSVDSKDARALQIGRDLLPRVSCSVAVVDLGDQRWPAQHLLVAASRGVHPRLALQLARQLSGAVPDDADGGGRLTATYVEPDIGSDAQSVGQHVLGRVLGSAFDDLARVDVARRVVVAASVEAGLANAVELEEPDAVILGLPRPGLLSKRFFGGVPARLCRRVDAPVVLLRQALPLGNRLRRGLANLLERVVPQVERDTRVELAARVQSSSSWDFDFIALISLSTVIAALGLLQNSAAVIIGAMLIAPLMTPILGVGLALAQGNAQLVKLALRTISFGVTTSLLVAFLVGWLDRAAAGELVRTPEMLGRGWPGLLDLFVAFVSGLAAAYANSRPGLVAALPGVAIAAALVPPIATSGLALAAGDLRLAYGAFLLFFTNMVAIVLASAWSLWAVGVRPAGRGGWLRHVGNVLLLLVVVLGVHLSQRPRVALSERAAAVVSSALPSGLRIASVRVEALGGSLRVILELGGTSPPGADVAGLVQARLMEGLDAPVELRLSYVWQDVLPARAR